MKLLKSLKKRYNWLFNIKFDKITGFYKYLLLDKEIFIRHSQHFSDIKDLQWVAENIYYHYYMPKDDETIVDLGAGYGEETVFLSTKSPNINFYGIEIQPVIFECLSNTLYGLGKNFTCSSMAIHNEPNIYLFSSLSYQSVGNEPRKGYIEIPCITWDNFIDKHNIETIDLLKMNIEGAEEAIMKSITNFSIIKRFIISCHDFRAEHGDGEHFRTKKTVVDILEKNNYEIKTFNYGRGWTEDWIYAQMKNL